MKDELPSDELIAAERPAFEVWCKSEGIDTALWIKDQPQCGYTNARTTDYWTGWIARALLAEQARIEPVAWVYWHPSDTTHDGPDTLHKKAVSRFTDDTRKAMMAKGWLFEPLYPASTAAQPLKAEQAKDAAEDARHRKENFDHAGWLAMLTRAVEARKVTWVQVGESTGVSPSTLSRMKEGRRPDAASLAALSSWAGINPAEFVVRAARAAERKA